METLNDKLKVEWDLSHIYRNLGEWNQACDELAVRVEQFKEYKGKLCSSGMVLYKCLKDRDQILIEKEKIIAYTALLCELDETKAEYRLMFDRAIALIHEIYNSISFLVPEIVSMEEHTVRGFVEETGELHTYKKHIDELLKDIHHNLSEEQNRLIQLLSNTFNSFNSIYTKFNDIDIIFEDIKLSDNTSERLTKHNYYDFIESKDREIRKQAYLNLHRPYWNMKNTLAENLLGYLSKEKALAQICNYESIFEMINMNASVYDGVIGRVNEYLPLYHKYLSLRRRRLKLDQLELYDLYVPLMKMDLDTKFAYDQSVQHISNSLQPLGRTYCNVLQELLTGGFIKVPGLTGSGKNAEFVMRSYGHNPYILFDYQPILNRSFTLTHKIGHAVNIRLTNASQPYVYSNNDPLVEEISAFVNEILLLRYFQDMHKGTEQEVYFNYLYIEKFRRTVFRQSIFAEFEMKIYSIIMQDGSFTAHSLNEIYKELNQNYFGSLVNIDELISIEWVRLPHLYSSFLVYRFILAYMIAIQIVENIMINQNQYVDRYIRFLSLGQSIETAAALKTIDINLEKLNFIDNVMNKTNIILEKLDEPFWWEGF